jgi:hypothetical protein
VWSEVKPGAGGRPRPGGAGARPSIAEDVGANDTGVHAGDLDAGVPPPFGELDGEQGVRELRAARDPQAGPVPPVLQVVEVQGVAVPARVGDKDDAAAGRAAQQVIRTSHEEVARQVVHDERALQTLARVLGHGGQDARAADDGVQRVPENPDRRVLGAQRGIQQHPGRGGDPGRRS